MISILKIKKYVEFREINSSVRLSIWQGEYVRVPEGKECGRSTRTRSQKKGEGQGMWQRVWWPLSCRLNKKFSFKATARPGQPFVKGGQKGAPSDERARTMRGACVSWCALFTQRQPRSTGELWCVALSLPFLFLPSGILLLARAFLASFSPSCAPRPTNIGVDKPPMYCETPRVIPANRGTAWRFYYEKAKR